MNKDKPLSVRLTPEDREKLLRLSQQENRDISDVIRQLIRKEPISTLDELSNDFLRSIIRGENHRVGMVVMLADNLLRTREIVVEAQDILAAQVGDFISVDPLYIENESIRAMKEAYEELERALLPEEDTHEPTPF